jgi:hypothetical protein
MTSISGDSHVYTAVELVSAISNIIIRTGTTAATTDTFPSAENIAAAAFGTTPANMVGQTFYVTIINNSDFTITQELGANETIEPSDYFLNNQDFILVGSTRSYAFTMTTNTTASVFVVGASSGNLSLGLPVPANYIVVGNNSNVGKSVPMSGEGSIMSTGVFSLGSIIANPVEFTDEIESKMSVTALSITDSVATLSAGTLSGLIDPVQEKDAVNKRYVDALVNGLAWREAASVCADTIIALDQTTTVIDGYTLQDGDRVLCIAQGGGGTGDTNNGLWTYSSTIGPWVRPSDFANGESASSTTMFVANGIIYKSTAFTDTNLIGQGVIGTNLLTFVQITDGSVGITSINAETVSQITISSGSSGTDFNVTTSAGTITYNLPDAGPSSRGAITVAAQTLAGSKTFTSVVEAKDGVMFADSNVGTVTLHAPLIIPSSYSLSLPNSQATASGQVMTSDATGGLSWETPFTGSVGYYYSYGPSAGMAVTSLPQIVLIAGSGQISFGGIATNSGGTLTFTEAGNYKVSYYTQFSTSNQSGGSRSSFACEIFNGAISVAGSTCTCYIREQSTSLVQPGAGKSIIMTIAIGDEITMKAYRDSGTTNGIVVADRCNILVERL